MKNKSIVAIVIGILCVAILASGLVWSMLDWEEPSADEKPNASQDDQQQENTDTPEEPKQEEPEDKEPETGEEPEPNVDQNPKYEEDQNDDSSNSKIDADPETYTGNANIATLTKEETEEILNNKYMVLVNRSHVLSSDYKGIDLVYYGDHRMNKVAGDALMRIIADGKEAGYNYVLYSGYRNYSHQYNNYYNKINYYKDSGYSEDEAIRLTNQYYAPPGASEHHTGLAADVCIPSIVNKYACLHENYEFTDEYEWFSSRAHEYGFILRYRKGDEDITGYNFEPWHYRYVGVDIATEIYHRDITFEEYVEELEARLKELS